MNKGKNKIQNTDTESLDEMVQLEKFVKCRAKQKAVLKIILKDMEQPARANKETNKK